jgi:vacuolar-type H+-ATPase subunit F/Vma7
MSLPVFIGDEVSAAGFRLAGVPVRVPAADDLGDCIRQAGEQAPLILLAAAAARRLPAAELDRLLAGVTPAVVVVPDVLGATPMPDLATRLRTQLGVLE